MIILVMWQVLVLNHNIMWSQTQYITFDVCIVIHGNTTAELQSTGYAASVI